MNETYLVYPAGIGLKVSLPHQSNQGLVYFDLDILWGTVEQSGQPG